MKCIVLTGGGTAGHVMPHIAWLKGLRAEGWDVRYVGSCGIEKQLISQQNVPFYEIPVGKLRRYWSLQNFIDPFKVLGGFFWSLFYLMRLKPDVVLSKGGFVSVPVALAGWCLRIPVVIHESDVTPGLANKISQPFASQVLYSFPETEKYISSKSQWLLPPVRSELKEGSRDRGLQWLGFSKDARPIVLVTGGSLGAARLNQAVVEELEVLLKSYRIVHLTGAGKNLAEDREGYKSFEYLGQELADVIAAADFVVARAGANSIFEFLELEKPMLLVPLEIGSRGDQLLNAQSFEKQGWAKILREKDLKNQLIPALHLLSAESSVIIEAQKSGKKTLETSPSLIKILKNIHK
ncbi:MAG: undecaprenyldiphospho-muramoylpentapeptide beta-N-acetylglucosaminyltransferase [Oligoflexales bacterium]